MRVDIQNSLLMVIDIQEKLFPHINDNEILGKNLSIFLQGLKILQVPYILNEQYKKGMGETIFEVTDALSDAKSLEKTCFSCLANPDVMQRVKKEDKKFVILVGVEAHICVLQTALELLTNGYVPVVVEDCIGSRKQNDKSVALQRLRDSGAIVTTYESLLFELLKDAKHPNFKDISKLIK